MNARMEFTEFNQLAPGIGEALRAISKAVDDSGLEKPLTELIKIRASQINGCTFCIQFHLNEARRVGVPQGKLDLVAAWRDAGIFSAREMAALAWTEELTHVTPHGVSDEAYENVGREFGKNELPFLISAVISINAWNRVAMAYRFSPPLPQQRPSQ